MPNNQCINARLRQRIRARVAEIRRIPLNEELVVAEHQRWGNPRRRNQRNTVNNHPECPMDNYNTHERIIE
nr:3362_t:CDS:2 [Entrophospora candida]